ncbi:hypothetical protein LY76DRAFT_486073, partial [Colletotrichum caudatum]
LCERYLIVYNLSYSTFSIIRLSFDEQTLNYVAIKVGTIYAATKEVEILSRLTIGVTDRSYATSEALTMIPTV